MPLNIKDEAIHARARELAARTGESITRAVGRAIEERLEKLRREAPKEKTDEDLVERIMEIARRSASRPVLDDRTADEILGYDEDGLPT